MHGNTFNDLIMNLSNSLLQDPVRKLFIYVLVDYLKGRARFELKISKIYFSKFNVD